jgi:hypothetical protein
MSDRAAERSKSQAGPLAEAWRECGQQSALHCALACLFQICQYFVGVALGLHLCKNMLDLAIRPNNESGAGNAHHFLAIHILFLQDSIGFGDLLVGIGEQVKGQLVFVLKLFLCFGRVRRNPNDEGTGLLNLLVRVAEPARFDGSAGSVGPRKEIQNDGLSAHLIQRDMLFVLVLQSKFGSFIIDVHAIRFFTFTAVGIRGQA